MPAFILCRHRLPYPTLPYPTLPRLPAHSPKAPSATATVAPGAFLLYRYAQGDSLVVYMRDLNVRVRDSPFAVGGMRHCYRMWDLGAGGRSRNPECLVGKQSK